MSTHATLGAAADERKARLAKLKSLKRKAPSPDPTSEEPSLPIASAPSSPDVTNLHLSGRNYDPEAKGPKLGFEAPPTLALGKPTLEQQAKEVEDEIRRKEEAEREEEEEGKGVDLFKLQPKKPNWDLKRDLDKKLEILDIRTENSIARMVRERVESAKAKARANGKGKGPAEVESGIDGVELVEGFKVREREEEEEERRGREDEEL
jgi:coiled-coil domain-containing protein 12